MDLKANTAVDVLIGPFVDSTDGNTTEDGLTISQADVKLSKNGQALTQKTDATAAAFDDDGYYNCELDATDTNTEGNLVLIVHEAGALPVRHEYNVMAEAAWDSLYAPKDTGFMDVNIKAVSESTTAADNAEIVYDTDFATNYNTTTDAWVTNHTNYLGTIPEAALGADCITAAKIADDALANEHFAAGALTDAECAANVTKISGDATAANNAESFFDGTGYAGTNNVIPAVTTLTGHTAQTGDSYALANGATGFVAIDTVVDAILAMLDGARAEPGQGAPAVNPDAMTKLDYLYKAWRNKATQTATTYSLYDDAGTTVDQKATVSDDATTATKGEVATGP